jgi:hypothetical protein
MFRERKRERESHYAYRYSSLMANISRNFRLPMRATPK